MRLRLVSVPAEAPQATLVWPRLSATAELATIGAGYAAYSLIRLAIRGTHEAAFGNAAQVWQAERWLHVAVEPDLNRVAAAHPVIAEAAGYYYGLLHFLVTVVVLVWLYRHRPTVFPRLRSTLFLTTGAANVVFWVWPLAPPRFSVPGMTDVLVTHHIMGVADQNGATGLVNLYAAMPSLHVGWAAWCALAVITASRGRWRHLAWLYPAATTLVVLATANHFLLDVAGGLVVAGLAMLATGSPADRGRADLPRPCASSVTARTPARETRRRRRAPAPGMWADSPEGTPRSSWSRIAPSREAALSCHENGAKALSCYVSAGEDSPAWLPRATPGAASARSESRTDLFAKRFHDAGFTVLAFDYRRLRESGGQPLLVLPIRGQLADWHRDPARAQRGPQHTHASAPSPQGWSICPEAIAPTSWAATGKPPKPSGHS